MPGETVVLRRPNPSLATRQARQAAQDLLRLVGIGIALDPFPDRLTVLRGCHAHRDQGVRLGEHVLVDHRRPLRDHHHAKTAHTAAAHDPIDLMEQALVLGQGALARELVGLVDDEMERRLVAAIELREKILRETRALADSHFAHVHDGRHIGASDNLRQAIAGSDVDRHVGMLAAEYGDREHGWLPVLERTQAPPHTRGIDDADTPAGMEKVFDKALRGVGLAGAGLAQDREMLVNDVAWGDHCPSFKKGASTSESATPWISENDFQPASVSVRS